MPCLKSRPAWAATLPNEKGRHPISFRAKPNTPPDYYIPCGRCAGCAVMRRREWGIRMYHESLCHERNCFVTLTYSDENLPGDLKINRHDPQTFMKRLRHHSQTPIRYFLTGEYGDKTKRPHYHAILFGEDFLGGGEYISNGLYTNKLLEAIWQHGTVGISQFNMSTALYVSGYVAKKCGDKDTFSIMSRNPPPRPGMG